ncbi:MAG TPA: LuxR C-terminal-related transcriptional regulator [Verrucomicrobiae bacterium]|nr:LuxR C-terminal-related transcriptional regulator [Verrucomicrobiae bacterium]
MEKEKLLSRRQTAVVELICQGLTDKETGARLNLSEETVGSCLKAVFQRYQVHSRAALTALWLENR